MTDQNKNDERVKNFIDGYRKLVTEHNIDLMHHPVFVPDGQGGFRVVIQSMPVDITPQEGDDSFVVDKK
jgi:hypothetical protein